MEDFNSKYTGQQVEDLLDQVASGNAGGGGGTITEADIASMGFTKNTGDYSKPSSGIPSDDLAGEVKDALRKAEQYTGTVTEIKLNGNNIGANNGVVDLGNLGTYSKPSTGIPKSDLNPSVQTSLGKADTAVQPEDIKDEVYIADFTMESLRYGIYNGTNVDCNVQGLVNAMNANKVILVREGEDSSYKGVYVLNGYAEDLLYFSIVDTPGNILWCDGADYMSWQSIDVQSLHERSWDDKQDTLVSGENIKTINGESILGSGNITIEGGGGSSGGGVEAISLIGGFGTPLIIEEMLAEKRYYLYVDEGLDGNEQTIVIAGFEGHEAVSEATIKHFYAVIECVSTGKGGSNLPGYNVSLVLPDVTIRWANGVLPSITGEGIYELSITQVNEYGLTYYNGVLTSFKSVE